MAKVTLTLYGVPHYSDTKTDTAQSTEAFSIETENASQELYFSKTTSHYRLSLVDFSFKKKMYQPTEVLATIQLSMVADSNNNMPNWEDIGKDVIEDAFLNRKVSVSDDSGVTIGSDFYVHEVLVHYKSNTMFVLLKIYSLDKLLTLKTGSKVFVAKKLGAQIMAGMMKTFMVPYEQSPNPLTPKTVAYNTDHMQVLNYGSSEHIFPYLVQYNESFYDMLSRTTNRWGEFLYYEDGQLNIGYDDKSNAIDVKDWTDLDFCELGKIGETEKSFDPAAAYHSNISEAFLKKSPDVIKNQPDSSMDDGKDVWIMKTINSLMNNTKSIPVWFFEQAVDNGWSRLVAEKNKHTVDSDFNDKYFKTKTVAEQYGKDGSGEEIFNPFTELNTQFNEDKYRTLLSKEEYAAKHAVNINFDTTCPNLKLGDKICVKEKYYIVVEIEAKKKVTYKYRLENGERVYAEPQETLVFNVVALQQDKDGHFYPATLPSGHTRFSGPQLATVFDADDPLNQNRVRIHFSWQEDLSEETASPWLVYSTSSASKSNGIFGRHYEGDAVIVNFANDNVENPYIVGGLALKGNKVPGSLSERDIVLSSPGGHTLRMDDGSGAGLTAFLAGTIFPGYDLLSTFVPSTSGKDIMSFADKRSKNFEGGFQLTDKYGVYMISGSTDGRNVTVKSPWGDVKIGALTGISISAPNGDVEIKGKNVKIEAGNNLELISGTNIKKHLFWKNGDTVKETSFNLAIEVGKAIAKKLQDKTQLLDLSLIRTLCENFLRPVEGALTVKSNRFLKLEAGDGECDYPTEAYKDKATVDKLKAKAEKTDLRPGIKIGKGMVELVQKCSTIGGNLCNNYMILYNRCYSQLNAQDHSFKKAIEDAKKWAEDEKTVCKSYEQLKDLFWAAPPYKKLKEADLGFDNNYNVEDPEKINNNKLFNYFRIAGMPSADIHVNQAGGNNAAAGNNGFVPVPGHTLYSLRAMVVAKRKACRKQILAAANELRKTICNFLEFIKLEDRSFVASRIGKFHHRAPAKAKDALCAAFSKNVVGAPFSEVTDAQKNLSERMDNTFNIYDADITKVKRMAAIAMIEYLGFKDEWRVAPVAANGAQPPVPPKPTAATINNDDVWNAYIESLSSIPALSVTDTWGALAMKAGMSIADGLFDIENMMGIANAYKEVKTWGNAKKGSILFLHNKNTYKLGDNIQEVEGIYKERLDSVEQPEIINADNGTLSKLKDALKSIS